MVQPNRYKKSVPKRHDDDDLDDDDPPVRSKRPVTPSRKPAAAKPAPAKSAKPVVKPGNRVGQYKKPVRPAVDDDDFDDEDEWDDEDEDNLDDEPEPSGSGSGRPGRYAKGKDALPDAPKWKQHLYNRGLTDAEIEYFGIEPAYLEWYMPKDPPASAAVAKSKDDVPGVQEAGSQGRKPIRPERGIEEKRKRFRIVSALKTPQKATGWRYPCYYPDEDATIYRYKSFPNANPAKGWQKVLSPYKDELPSEQHPPFYVPHKAAYQDLLKDIETKAGVLWGIEGEPDVWALRRIKILSIGFVGVKNIPDDLAIRLQRMGVKKFLYMPDADHAGWIAAQRISDLLYNSPVKLESYNTPQEWDGRKVKDTTDLLKVMKFEQSAFGKYLVDFLRGRKLTFKPPEVREQLDDKIRKRYKPELRDEIEMRLLGQAGQFRMTPYKDDNFSQNIPCPFCDHPNDRTGRKNPAFGWNKESMWGCCFKCANGVYSPEDIARVLGIKLEDYIIQDTRTPKDKPKTKKRQLDIYTGEGVDLDDPRSFVSRQSEVMQEAVARANGEVITDDAILPFPINDQRMFAMDGLARALPAGRMVLVMGPSGGGKTTTLTYMEHNYNLIGVNTLRWSPEYTARQHGDKLIQKFGGATYMDSLYNDVFWQEQQNPIGTYNYGRKLDDNKRLAVIQTANSISNWAGDAFIVNRYGRDIYELLDMFDATCDYALSIGRELSTLFFDYAQLPRSPDGNPRWSENDTAHALKEWANQRYEYESPIDGARRLRKRKSVILGSQITKLSSKKDKEGEQEITEEDANRLSPQWFNLILGVRQYLKPHPDPAKAHLQETQLITLKNSDGRKYSKRNSPNKDGYLPGVCVLWYDTRRGNYAPDKPMEDYPIPYNMSYG